MHPLPRIHCPPTFWLNLGYTGTARFVAIGYEYHSDGNITAGGAASNWWAFRQLLRDNNLDGMAYHFGSDEDPADDYLVVDRGTDLTRPAIGGWIVSVEDAIYFVNASADK
jgi:hypothetical protein